jgi:RecB family exonuclease
MGPSLLSFEDFLLKFVKINHHRVHVADEKMSLYLLFLLIHRKHKRLLDGKKNVAEIVGELYTFFLHVKKCGLGPERAMGFLTSHLEDPGLLDLFEDYQKHLQELHYFDPADLYLATINALKTPSFKWFNGVDHLYLSKIYPLHAGHREILRLLKNTLPELKIHVFYDEDHRRKDDLLSQSYEDLGALSDHEEHFAGTNQLERAILECPSPNQEISFTIAEIKKLIRAGIPPHAITIACSLRYEILTKLILKRHGIPYSVNFTLKVAEFLPPPTNLESLTANEYFPTNLINLAKQENIFAINKLQALNALSEHQEKIQFLQSVFSNLCQDIPKKVHADFLDVLQQSLGFNAGSDQHEVTLMDFNRALPHSDRYVFLLGLSIENISFQGNQTLYSPYLYVRREFAELLNFPTYQYKIAIENLKQLIATTPHLTITRALKDFSGKPTTPIPFENIDFKTTIYNEENISPRIRLDKNFVPTTKLKFSLSEIQRYIDCPYQYYASHHLKLEAIEKEGMEPPPDTRGSFAHQALEKFFKIHFELYVAALKNEEDENKLLKLLDVFLCDESTSFEKFKTFEPKLTAAFTKRLSKAVSGLLREEIRAHRESKKVTLPKNMEWALEHNGKPGWNLKTKHGTVPLPGRIDRLDVDETGRAFTVIDYKTGKPPTTTDIRDGVQIQLPVYMMAVESDLYPGFSPSGGFYYQFREAKVEGFAVKGSPDAKFVHHRRHVPEDEWEDIKVKVKNRIETAVDGILQGHFAPAPRSEDLCDYCDYKRICGYKAKSE